MPDERDRPGDLPFPDAIEPFVRACPGPALAIGALRVVAHQPINGIAGLELDPAHKKPAPVRTLNRAASAVFCTADHLSKAAARYGPSCWRSGGSLFLQAACSGQLVAERVRNSLRGLELACCVGSTVG